MNRRDLETINRRRAKKDPMDTYNEALFDLYRNGSTYTAAQRIKILRSMIRAVEQAENERKMASSEASVKMRQG